MENSQLQRGTPTFIRIDSGLRHKLRHQAFAQNTTQYDLLNKIVAEWLNSQAQMAIQ
ncbi:hypothetical protein [Chroococcidiopsis sp.]|uniref:hypothetical protein n=1 Tax=Chroococcidiopsis sp. TaxID=3088168 RepID=UPI003F3C0331